jgi:hypothetical protein
MSLTSCDEIVVVHDMLQDVVYSIMRYFRGAGVDLNALCAPDICLVLGAADLFYLSGLRIHYDIQFFEFHISPSPSKKCFDEERGVYWRERKRANHVVFIIP